MGKRSGWFGSGIGICSLSSVRLLIPSVPLSPRPFLSLTRAVLTIPPRTDSPREHGAGHARETAGRRTRPTCDDARQAPPARYSPPPRLRHRPRRRGGWRRRCPSTIAPLSPTTCAPCLLGDDIPSVRPRNCFFEPPTPVGQLHRPQRSRGTCCSKQVSAFCLR